MHALVSEYRPGTPIGWHRDKPVYGIVAGISLAGTGRMRFRPYDAQDAEHTHTLDLAPGSLYVMRDAIRWRWQHSLLPVKTLRYSITLRTRATAARTGTLVTCPISSTVASGDCARSSCSHRP